MGKKNSWKIAKIIRGGKWKTRTESEARRLSDAGQRDSGEADPGAAHLVPSSHPSRLTPKRNMLFKYCTPEHFISAPMTLYSFTLFLWWFSNILSQVIHWLDLKKKKMHRSTTLLAGGERGGRWKGTVFLSIHFWFEASRPARNSIQ